MSDRNKTRKLAHQLERYSWLLVFLAMLTQGNQPTTSCIHQTLHSLSCCCLSPCVPPSLCLSLCVSTRNQILCLFGQYYPNSG